MAPDVSNLSRHASKSVLSYSQTLVAILADQWQLIADIAAGWQLVADVADVADQLLTLLPESLFAATASAAVKFFSLLKTVFFWGYFDPINAFFL